MIVLIYNQNKKYSLIKLMKLIEILSILLLILSVYSFDFGETTINLYEVNGGTATLRITTEKNGTTAGSDLSISNLKLACYPKYYDLTCVLNKQISLSSLGTTIQCSIEESIPTSSKCTLYDDPTIQSTGDTFNSKVNSQTCVSTVSKFGKTQLEPVKVEGNLTTIKIIPERTGVTTTSGLYIKGLTVNNKALTCEADKILNLEASSGTQLNCSTTEEIDANIKCKLGGNPQIFSPDDSFDAISYKTTQVTSSFGKVKIGLISVKGTAVWIEFISQYKGTIKVDVSGLEINGTRILDCPATSLTLSKDGIQLECTINQGVNEEDLCILTQTNLKSNALPNIEINEDKKSCIAKVSKYGKVQISLTSVYGKKVVILIKTTFSGPTESNKFSIDNLKLHVDNSDYTMTCSISSKITLSNNGTNFTCSIGSKINGGKDCSLKGTPIFNSEGDTFSDITVLANSVPSSFGEITITPVSIIGKNVIIKLTSEITGTTTSSIISLENLKIGTKNISCPIGVNINFSDKPEFTCTLAEIWMEIPMLNYPEITL